MGGIGGWGIRNKRFHWEVEGSFISQRQIQETALNSLAPEYVSSKFTERIESGYAIRDSTNKLAFPLARTNDMKESSLPCDPRRERSFNRFKP